MPKVVSYKEGSGGGYFKAPAGGYPAIIVGVMELGTEMRTFKEGSDPKAVTEIRIVYEIEAEQEKYDKEKEETTGEFEDRIGVVGQNYSEVVSDGSNLGKVIKAVYDVETVKEIKNFSMDKLLGLKCYIEVDLVGKKKNIEIVKSVSGLNKKMEALLHEQETKPFYFGMEDPDDFIDMLEDDEAKKVLKPWDIDRIKASPEWKKLMESFGIETPTTLEEDEANIEKEIAQNKASKPEDEKTEELSQDVADEIFTDEPKTTTEAREKAKNDEAPNSPTKGDDPFKEQA